MPFDAVTFGHVENALTDAFRFHSALDTFLLRSGLNEKSLAGAREIAEGRANASISREYQRAPKRFVVQEVLKNLGCGGAANDRVVAALIDALIRGSFPDASADGLDAIAALKSKREDDRQKREDTRQQGQEESARKARDAARQKEQAYLISQQKRDTLRDRFLGLISEGNAQSRGYLLETFLSDLFELEGLDPRGSFKIVGEQIDGSFFWRSRTNLLEAKWVKSPVAGVDFGAFIYKIEGKTADTRSVFVSINGYSNEALTGLNGKGALKFVCIDGSHLMRVLTGSSTLPQLLERVWRHADETGQAYILQTGANGLSS